MSSPAPQQNATPGPSSNQGGGAGGADNKQSNNGVGSSSSGGGDQSSQQQPPPTPTQTQQQQQQQRPSAANLPSQDDLDKIVASYLQKKGYKATGTIFAREASGNTLSLEELSQVLASSGGAAAAAAAATSASGSGNNGGASHVFKYKDAEEGDPDAYNVSYRNLREWIEKSLDWYKVSSLFYILVFLNFAHNTHAQWFLIFFLTRSIYKQFHKPELRSVLFPIFVHAYLDLVSKNLSEQAKYFMETYKKDHVELHSLDISRLETVTTPDHIRENELAQMYRNNKYNLRMSSVPFELFLNYLQDNKYMLLLRIVNQYLNIQVVHGKLKSAGGLEMDDMAGVIGIAGHEAQQIESFNQQKVQLGGTQMDPALREEVERTLKERDAARKEQAASDPTAVIEPGVALLDTFKKVKQEATADGPAFGDIPLPQYRGTDIEAELESLKDLRKRVSLGSASLPSVCCYTFHNTHDGLNCLAMTEDTSLIAGGFSESFIKIWSLKGEKLKGLRNTVNPAHVNDYNDLNRQKERHGSEYKRLVGHAGPVYGVSFSHDNKYLISCSEDKTARLWSTQTFSNLVCYKGHNYPIWDVDFGPYGFYFATASHDRTARLWSCDHIHPLRIFSGHLSDVDTVKFHPNSKYLVTGSSDRTCRLWDVQRGTCVRVFTGHTGSIKTVAVSPNGRLMASAGEDKSIMLWDLGSGRRLKRMTGHTGFIYSLAFSADSHVLVSGGADSTVRVWDVNKDTLSSSTTAAFGSSEDGVDAKRIRLDESSPNSKKDKKDLAKEKVKEEAKRKKGAIESHDQLGVFPTKHTPIYDVQFTKRNLCLAAGAFSPPEASS
ncbi:WD40-repeat-containing domain protein [Zychaea mexicana]|uniref:WD40-repeat-containing domain protein n=1 Tax=Zychaea mexicana TaxID=64656 RepID=UPI0022FDD2A0|nr:WD40-repeat-containing domain protein [Zychaea mexicana]KAI9482612.1 WD40-repeat-containing domain protein [Zychaea mexicana]